MDACAAASGKQTLPEESLELELNKHNATE
jgi:hypothetical protein